MPYRILQSVHGQKLGFDSEGNLLVEGGLVIKYRTDPTVIDGTGTGGIRTNGGSIAAGANALPNIADDGDNTAYGVSALANLASGGANTVSGNTALANLTSGSANVSYGDASGQNLITGDDNAFFGQGAGTNDAASTGRTAIGRGAICREDNTVQLGADTTTKAICGNEQLQVGSIRTVSVQFDKTNDTTLDDIPGLSVDVHDGFTYAFEATLYTTSNVGTGVKAAIGGDCTAVSIIYEGETISSTSIAARTRATAMGSAVAGITAVTAARIDIKGTIKVNIGGTLTVQFAENAGIAATVSSVLIGSSFEINRVT